MQPASERRVEDLRTRANAAKAELHRLRTALADNKDEYINGLLRQASFWLGDIETFFVAMLQKESVPPRTAPEEARILDGAELPLNGALWLIRNVEDLVNRYGPKLESIG